VKALVIGGTGFIGGHIARAASERGWRVSALRRRPGAVGALQGVAVGWLEGDLNDRPSLENAMAGQDVVFHAAGYYPRRGGPVAGHVRRAVLETRNVLAASARVGVPRLVFTSTLTTIGRPPEGEGRLADERDAYLPASLYWLAYYECKYAMESEVLRAAAGGLPAVVVNPTAVLGPGDVHLTVAAALLAAARGRMPFWIEAPINVVDVRDVAQAQLAAAARGEVGERYILGGHNVTVRLLLEVLAELVGRRAPRWRLPLELIDALSLLQRFFPALNLLGNHLAAVRHWQGYDCRKAEEVLGLQPRPLEETLRDALAWLRDEGYL